MLEYNFNTLDNDFVTIWSRYIKTNDVTLIINDLEKLAELGQVNAVQNWYLFRKEGDNAKIDSIVQSYIQTQGNYNELWAIGNYYSSDSEQMELLYSIIEEYEEFETKANQHRFYGEDEREFARKANEQRNKYYNETFYHYFNDATWSILSLAQRLEELPLYERVAEMQYTLASYIPFSEEALKLHKTAKKNNKIFIKKAIKEYKSRIKANPNLNINDDVMFYFSLAKGIILFKNKKYYKIGFDLLTQLSNRDYSSEFNNYSIQQVKVKTTTGQEQTYSEDYTSSSEEYGL